MQNILKPFKRRIGKINLLDTGFPTINIPMFLVCNRITKALPKFTGCVLGICKKSTLSPELCEKKRFLNRSIECDKQAKVNCYNKP